MTRSNPRLRHGEVISLYWEGDPEAEYVRGHVTPRDGCEALARAGRDAADYQSPTHEYGRCSMDARRADGCDWVLRVYQSPGRGRFLITVYRRRPA